MILTKQEKEAIVIGLQMRVAYIETGDPMLRASDVQNGHRGKIQALSPDQMRLIILSEDLIKKIYNT